MPWYKSGTVSVVLNSNAVIGTGTAFIANSRVGDAFRGPDGGWYEVTNIASDTALSISPNYQGATNATGVYALAPIQGYVKESADALRALVNQFGGVLAVLGTTPTTAGVRTALNLSNTDGLSEGASNKYLTNARVIASTLTGLDLSSATAVVAVDSILVALGKLQAQVSSKALKGANSDITSLTGLTTALSLVQGGTGVTSITALLSALQAAGAYAKGNILGTVSQTGGVPTGAVIERGSNSQGEFVKYADGTLICRIRVTTSSINVANGGVFNSLAVSPGVYPSPFIAVPVVTSSGSPYGYNVVAWSACYAEPTQAVWGQWCGMAPTSTVGFAYINLIAVGRWF